MQSGPDYMQFFRARAEASKDAPMAERERQMMLAMIEWENANLLVPIDRRDLERLPPERCRRVLADFEQPMIEAFDAGTSLQDAFDAAFHPGIFVFRPMDKGERMTPGDLLLAMSERDRDTARRALGKVFVTRSMINAAVIGSPFLASTPNP